MMLSKEEYLKALSIVENHDDVDELIKNRETIENLIEEHFELVNEYKDVRKELECYYEMMSNTQPYKFEELKEGMWVYDDIYEDCVLISRICGEKEFECGNICEYRCFTDGRFYPVWMANVGCE